MIPSSDWHYVAERINGDGTYVTIYDDLPLADVQIDDVLSGDNGLSGTLSPEHPWLRDFYGDPKAAEWKTAIWAIAGGQIQGGGIVNNVDIQDQQMTLECVGFTGYLKDLPYVGSTHFVETDVLDIVRHIWDHVQSQPHGNLDLQVDQRDSGVSVGIDMAQQEFGTESGPLIYEDQAYKLAWYQDHDLSGNFQELLTLAGIDFHERHVLELNGTISHYLDFGSGKPPTAAGYDGYQPPIPKIGRVHGGRFVIGENIYKIPAVARNGAAYATEILYLGAGEGAAMVRGGAWREPEGLRRVSVLSDTDVRSAAQANSRSQAELAWRSNLGSVTEIALIDHSNAPVGSVSVGDTIRLQGDAGWVDLNSTYRVIGRSLSPHEPEVESLTVVRTDIIAS